MAFWAVNKNGESMLDITLCMMKPYGERMGWSHEAMETFARQKLREMPCPVNASDKWEAGRIQANWIKDNIVCPILNFDAA